MKRFGGFLVLAVLVLGLGGCGAWAEYLFGVKPDGTQTPGGGILGTAAQVVNYWIPGVTALVGGAATVIAAIKARNWKKAAISTFETIEAGAAVGKSVADLKPDLMAAHSVAGVAPIVEKALDKYVRE